MMGDANHGLGNLDCLVHMSHAQYVLKWHQPWAFDLQQRTPPAALCVCLSSTFSLSHTLHPEMTLLLGGWLRRLTTVRVWCPWQSTRYVEKTEPSLCSGENWSWAGKGWLHEEFPNTAKRKQSLPVFSCPSWLGGNRRLPAFTVWFCGLIEG